MRTKMGRCLRTLRNQKGVSDLVTMVLIISLVAIASVATLTLFSDTIKDAFTGIIKVMTGQSHDMKDRSSEIKMGNQMDDVFHQESGN